MPVVSCPKCPTKLKVPDGVSGNTKCPKCGTVFPVAAPAPAFEVVDEKPAGSKASAPAPKTAPKPAAKPEADEEDEKPKKRVTADADDDDEDDRPRKKKRRDDDDDEDDDRPRAKKKKRRDDDDDDDDDRPRKKKKKKKARYDDDDDDDDEWQPKPSKRAEFARGKTGAMLLSISFWLNLGAYGLLALYALIFWILVLAASSSSGRGGGGSARGGGGDGSFMEIIVVLPGLVGLGAWIVGTVGCAFTIAGPARARGMAITATVFAGLHLILTGVTFSNLHGSSGGGFGMGRMGMGSPAWIIVASTLPALDALFPLLFYASRAVKEGDYIIALLAAICEVLRLVFALLALKEMAAAARDRFAAEKAQFGMTAAIFVVSGVLIFVLLMVVLMAEGKFKSFETIAHLGAITLLMTYLGYTFMMLNPAMAALQVKDACDSRS